MAVNNPQGHNQYTGHKKSTTSDADNKRSPSGTSGVKGGTSEQHAEAGRQSHKNDEKSSGAKSGGKESSS